MGDSVKLGQSYLLTIPVTDGALPPATPTPLDPATLTVTGRSLTTGATAFTRTIGQLTRLGIGDYRLDVLTGTGAMLPAVDTYSLDVVSTNPNSVQSTWLDVRPNVPGVVDLGDARAQLSRSGKARSDDPLLETYVEAVNDWLRSKVGAVLPELVVEAVAPSPWTGRAQLSTRPVLSIVSATYDGVAVSTTGWAVDASARLTFKPGTYAAPYPWLPATDGLVVTYRAGRSPVPQTIPLAGAQLLDHLWESRRSRQQTPAPGGFSDEMVTVMGRGYFVPNMVAQMLEPYALDVLPGVA